jgi:hypothetical protein
MSMIKINPDLHVLPRPVGPLPEYAHAKSRNVLADRLVDAFGMSAEAAAAVASAVVDPSAVRSGIGEPTDPKVERIPVPGGTLLGIRTHVWARRIMPDPRNPRIGPSRRHPFAVDPGSGADDSRFRPVPEPRSPKGNAGAPEMIVELDSREHLEWGAAQATHFILRDNDWRDSIASQGVMESVWVAATTYTHADGSAPATVLTTVEGSSRTTAVHALLGVRSADVPYESSDQWLRSHIRKLNEALERGATTGEQEIDLRCERMPALILVGFRPSHEITGGFPTAVKSLVALRHVDPPKAWGDGPENEALADEVLDELYRRQILSRAQHAYYTGSLTKAEARAARFSDDPVIRAAELVQLFTSAEPELNEGIRVAVTSQSTRKRITTKLRNDLATALILRALDGSGTVNVDQVRRYLRHAYGKAVHTQPWAATGRATDALVKEALREVRRSIGDATVTEPGLASVELAVRAAYPLIVAGALNADRGTADNDQPDRRTPGEVLEAMRRTVPGVHQLGQALRDFANEMPIRAVDEAGEIIQRRDGNGAQVITDTYLRVTFPPPGKLRARSGGEQPLERLSDRVTEFSTVVGALEKAIKAVRDVVGPDGGPLVEVEGIDPRHAAAWRESLRKIDEDLLFWGKTFARRRGSSTPRPMDVMDGYDDGDEDAMSAEVDAAYEASYNDWDGEGGGENADERAYEAAD